MNALRRRLIGFASAWLFMQIIVLTVTPISLCANAAMAESQARCSCVHTAGDSASCPMHRHPIAHDAPCRCQSNTLDPSTAAIATLLGPAGVLTSASGALFQPSLSGPVESSASGPVSWEAVPDGPPPRA